MARVDANLGAFFERAMHAGYQGPNAEKALAQIQLRLEAALNYPPAQARVARYILENPEEAVHQSLRGLSAASRSGQATIFRLCRELGFRGFKEFKLALATENGERKANLTGGPNRTQSLLEEAVWPISRSVLSTGEMLRPEVLSSTASRLARARQVNIYGSGDSGPSADVLFHRLSRAGINARIFANVGYAHEAAETMSKVDAAIGVSQSGASRDTVEFLQKAHSVGAFSLAITCCPKSRITKLSDVVLKMARLPHSVLSARTTSTACMVFLAEALAISISEANGCQAQT
ncbi:MULTISPECIES: MurR/RpiR family transcriptional regulator [unclassified Rhizobium]|uniref:MurR/RpiR family transcriptional regulator n=1 Tax=unclassified Rhizobium TaxID=2613769 RepID=UPI001C8358EC|nr:MULTISPECIES: MurR/RpiR family transcriptional regulator [unclassified Rhizobium]MBX5213735.1 MurR/RpiR family transcriptional regulator [Rhizobium sp. NLR9a]MBX5219114.1 MurR/RpiR family transcriptional regulator [Rhizobium sp. NLR8a]MBX5232952.1 MurR/RpiR family transcriptional regulator [Rhizobium sp. NLR4a]MBX5246101.1 MurR/RpiR family transcriptional regulator [Rhizobium sp. NLR3b]MBX5275124.1 MurR/RpiR family transcriptional regulator [Rhizobium sp. NLR13a]